MQTQTSTSNFCIDYRAGKRNPADDLCAEVQARIRKLQEEKSRGFVQEEAYKLLGITLLLDEAYHKAWSCLHGIKYQRYQMHESSLATWMLTMAGIINYHPKANAQRFARFADFFRRQCDGESFDKEERDEYGTCRKQLCEYTISMADVIWTNSSDSWKPLSGQNQQHTRSKRKGILNGQHGGAAALALFPNPPQAPLSRLPEISNETAYLQYIESSAWWLCHVFVMGMLILFPSRFYTNI